MAADDIAAGAWGRSGEGWFDGYQLMQALRRKARSLGVETLTGDVAAITHEAGRATGVRLADGTTIAGAVVVLTAGTETPRLAATVGVTLPVEARKRMVFTFACRAALPGFPLLIDPSGAYVRPEGEIYLSGMAPAEEDDPPASDFSVDHAFFEETLWPILAARVPAFEAIKPGRAWAGHYDFNTFDQNAIVGALPGFANLACGHRLLRPRPAASAGNRPRACRVDRARPLSEPRPFAAGFPADRRGTAAHRGERGVKRKRAPEGARRFPRLTVDYFRPAASVTECVQAPSGVLVMIF